MQVFNRLGKRLFADPHGALSLISRLFHDYGRRYWRRYVISIVMLATVAGCTSSFAYLVGKAINEAYVNKNLSGIVFVSTAAIIISIVKGLATYGQIVTMASISNRITAENQRRIFDKLLEQNLAFYADRHSSEFTARINYGVGAPASVIAVITTVLGRDVLTILGLGAIMLVQAPILFIISLLVIPPSALFVRQLIKRVRNLIASEFSGGARILETLQETIQGFRVVKALNLEDVMRRRVADDIESVRRLSNKLARISNRSTPLMEALGGIAIALVILFGGYRVLVSNAPPGEFFTFAAAFLLIYEPVKRVARLNVDLAQSLIGVRMVYDLLDLPASENDDGKPPLVVTQGKIEFSDVSFAYRVDEPVLESMSFVAEPGKLTALIGPSGGGKSTIFNMLLRFFDVGAGAITIDGQDIASVSRQSVRESIAYVGQDTFLFKGSIRDNIALGRLGATEEEIVAAAKAAHAHEFIMDFPLGYDSPVGEHGMQLSGGQRQRIAVARALIRNAPIILLDEPTASLDTESERQVHLAIARLLQGRTKLVIAHRLHTIEHADMIYVVEDGRIVECGRHESLLRQGRRYADFHSLQFAKSNISAELLLETALDAPSVRPAAQAS